MDPLTLSLLDKPAIVRQAGPPEPMSRLEYLASNRENSAAPEVKGDSTLGFIAPLIMSQMADYASSRNLVNEGGGERNPAPGMQSGLGRFGWGLTEALAIALLGKKLPSIARNARNALIPIHGGLALGNNYMIDEMKARAARDNKR